MINERKTLVRSSIRCALVGAIVFTAQSCFAFATDLPRADEVIRRLRELDNLRFKFEIQTTKHETSPDGKPVATVIERSWADRAQNIWRTEVERYQLRSSSSHPSAVYVYNKGATFSTKIGCIYRIDDEVTVNRLSVTCFKDADELDHIRAFPMFGPVAPGVESLGDLISRGDNLKIEFLDETQKLVVVTCEVASVGKFKLVLDPVFGLRPVEFQRTLSTGDSITVRRKLGQAAPAAEISQIICWEKYIWRDIRYVDSEFGVSVPLSASQEYEYRRNNGKSGKYVDSLEFVFRESEAINPERVQWANEHLIVPNKTVVNVVPPDNLRYEFFDGTINKVIDDAAVIALGESKLRANSGRSIWIWAVVPIVIVTIAAIYLGCKK